MEPMPIVGDEKTTCVHSNTATHAAIVLKNGTVQSKEGRSGPSTDNEKPRSASGSRGVF